MERFGDHRMCQMTHSSLQDEDDYCLHLCVESEGDGVRGHAGVGEDGPVAVAAATLQLQLGTSLGIVPSISII